MAVYGFGEKIKDLRTRRNLSQEEVAKRVELTKATISGYERGIKSPSVEAVVNLALLFNVSTDYLLGINNRNIIRGKVFSQEEQKEILRILGVVEDFVVQHEEFNSHER